MRTPISKEEQLLFNPNLIERVYDYTKVFHDTIL